MPDFLLKPGSIVLLLGGLIFVHELGHFVVAKLLGVKVVRFSIGFGPRLFGFTKGETEYRISVLPLGGYVKMAGDDPTEQVAPEDRGRGFLEQSPWKRLVIALAGPAMNLAFPGVIYVALAVSQNGQPVAAPIIGMVLPDSAAERAGLQPGDRIVAVTPPGADAPRPLHTFQDLRDLVSPYPGQEVRLDVERGGQRVPEVRLVPAPQDETTPLERSVRGVIGVSTSYAPALAAPALPGAAGPLEPFDLVTAVDGRPVHNAVELAAALAGAACKPADLDVIRDGQRKVPGAVLASYGAQRLAAVPTCRAGGAPAVLLAASPISTVVPTVSPGSPAEQAGLRRGDVIVAVDGKKVRSFNAVADVVNKEWSPGKPGTLALSDGRLLTVVPTQATYVDEVTGKTRERTVIGFQNDRTTPVSDHALVAGTVPLERGPSEIAGIAWKQLYQVVRLTVLGISRIVTGDISFKTVGGPIMLVNIASEAVEEGWGSFFFTMALISVNLGLMNLLPIPVLDGGHIAQAAVEGVTRRPLSIRAREIANIVGLILLFTLMLFVFKNDIVRYMRPPMQ